MTDEERREIVELIKKVRINEQCKERLMLLALGALVALLIFLVS